MIDEGTGRNMLYEFSRTELLLGKEGLDRLKEATVTVLGVGGVGSHCIEALARSGVGHLVLVDHDTVSLTNINRQSIALHSTIGQYKTKVMRRSTGSLSSVAWGQETSSIRSSLRLMISAIHPSARSAV